MPLKVTLEGNTETIDAGAVSDYVLSSLSGVFEDGLPYIDQLRTNPETIDPEFAVAAREDETIAPEALKRQLEVGGLFMGIRHSFNIIFTYFKYYLLILKSVYRLNFRLGSSTQQYFPRVGFAVGSTYTR